MGRAGFSDTEIENLGPSLREALATHGSASIRSRNFTEALLLAHGQLVHVSSRGRGGF